MKKIWVIPLLVALLSGCSKQPVLETVTDVLYTPVLSTMQRILVQLPPELSSPALQSEQAGKLYLCDDYSVTIETVEAGDLEKTIRNATGMQKQDLQILQTQQGETKRYQWVWAANSETGIQVGRGCILDDGAYHYVLTALTDENTYEKIQPAWKEIFASFRLASEREEVSTGS
jgi:hypothetical protein